MTTIFVRTIIIYVILLFAMRLMGKRQIGELEVSDLITTLLISEIASLPITETNLPISHAVIPIIILLTFEVISSTLLVKFPSIRRLLSGSPTTLIKNGKLNPLQMEKARITADELISELRRNNISDIDEVQYAILEQNGKISVIQKPENRSVSLKDMNIKTENSGLCHIVVENGHIDAHGSAQTKLSKKDIEAILMKRGMALKDVYLMLVDDSGKISLIKKETK